MSEIYYLHGKSRPVIYEIFIYFLITNYILIIYKLSNFAYVFDIVPATKYIKKDKFGPCPHLSALTLQPTHMLLMPLSSHFPSVVENIWERKIEARPKSWLKSSNGQLCMYILVPCSCLEEMKAPFTELSNVKIVAIEGFIIHYSGWFYVWYG